jgi:hypothetical protein
MDIVERAHRYLDYGSKENVNELISGLLSEVDRTANNRDMWKGQCERQAAEIERLRSPSLEGQEPVAVVRLHKLPSAFRVLRHPGVWNIYEYYANEDQARVAAEAVGVPYEGLYVRDGTPLYASPLLPDGYVAALNDIRSEARMAQQDLMQADDEEVNGHLNVIMRIVDRAMLSTSPKQEDGK